MTTSPPPSSSPLAAIARKAGRYRVRLAIVGGVLALLVALVLWLDVDGDLSFVETTMLSGPEEGFYHARVESLREVADRRGAQLENVATAGSMDNLERLAEAASSGRCDASFALVQDGLPWPAEAELELLGRLPRSESLFLLGRDADRLTRFEQLRGLRIGIGAEGSGTARLARSVFEHDSLAPLALTLSHHAVEEQLAMLRDGRLDLGAFVIDEDAPLVARALTTERLQMADLEHLDVIARRLPSAWVGRIGAGQFDPVAVLPPTDRKVLRIDTLVVANSCPSRSERIAMLGLLAELFPTFVEHNKARPNQTGLPLDDAAADYYEQGGVGFVDRYFPWVVDLMPLGNWVYLVMGVSVLFNIMGGWNRFRLWRLDANRVKVEAELQLLFGASTTLGEIDGLQPTEAHLAPDFDPRLERLLGQLEALLERCRRQAVSMLVPMGAELTWRYQEHTINDTLDTLRAFRARAATARVAADEADRMISRAASLGSAGHDAPLAEEPRP